jgi:hypothetical protein
LRRSLVRGFRRGFHFIEQVAKLDRRYFGVGFQSGGDSLVERVFDLGH